MFYLICCSFALGGMVDDVLITIDDEEISSESLLEIRVDSAINAPDRVEITLDYNESRWTDDIAFVKGKTLTVELGYHTGETVQVFDGNIDSIESFRDWSGITISASDDSYRKVEKQSYNYCYVAKGGHALAVVEGSVMTIECDYPVAAGQIIDIDRAAGKSGDFFVTTTSYTLKNNRMLPPLGMPDMIGEMLPPLPEAKRGDYTGWNQPTNDQNSGLSSGEMDKLFGSQEDEDGGFVCDLNQYLQLTYYTKPE